MACFYFTSVCYTHTHAPRRGLVKECVCAFMRPFVDMMHSSALEENSFVFFYLKEFGCGWTTGSVQQRTNWPCLTSHACSLCRGLALALVHGTLNTSQTDLGATIVILFFLLVNKYKTLICCLLAYYFSLNT